MNYLQLVQALRLEVGAEGEGPGSVESLRGEQRRLAYFVAEADMLLSTLWEDWSFLWREHRMDAPAYQWLFRPDEMGFDALRAMPMAEAMARIDDESVTWRAVNADGTLTYDCARALARGQWREMQVMAASGTGTPTSVGSVPSCAALRHDGALAVWPAPGLRGELRFGYWARPHRMAHNLDEPLIPAQYHRAIVVRAKLLYAEHEDAQEMFAPVAAELAEWLQRLESSELPSGRYRRRSELAEDELLVRAL